MPPYTTIRIPDFISRTLPGKLQTCYCTFIFQDKGLTQGYNFFGEHFIYWSKINHLKTQKIPESAYKKYLLCVYFQL